MTAVARKVFLIAIMTIFAKVLVAQKVFKSLNRNSYYIEPEKRYNWFQSQNECTLLNMTLLSIDSQAKNEELTNLLKDVYKDQTLPKFYIGGQDLGQFRTFVWISTGKRFEYTNWASKETSSNDNKKERCIILGIDGTDKWNITNCYRRYGFICEERQGAKEPQNLI